MSSDSFTALGVPARLAQSLAAAGIAEPFPIQRDTLPDSLAGRDVLGRGRTGSGKTIAFALPLVARLAGGLAGGRRRAGRPLGLVLAPTRELATQIAAVIEPLAATAGMTVTTIFGGVSAKPQIAALRAAVDIVVACPGRLEDLMKQRELTLDAVEITVLDEADHMADLGFLPVVTRLLAATPRGGQRLLFSATLDNGVDTLVKKFLSDPVLHSVDEIDTPVSTMRHAVFTVAGLEEKKALVTELASGSGRRILFLRTKHAAKKLAQQLTAAGIPAVDLQGNLSQNARERNLAAFGTGDVRVLVATDVAARGVHVDDVELVLHVDPPLEHKAYLHRSGRTARAGASGVVATIALPTQESDLRHLLKKAAIAAPFEPVTPASASVQTLVGVRAAPVAPAPRAAHEQQRPPRAPRQDQGGRRGDAPRGDRSRSAGRTAQPARGQGGRPAAARTERSGGRSASGRPTADQSRRPAAGSRSVWSSDGGSTARQAPRRAQRP